MNTNIVMINAVGSMQAPTVSPSQNSGTTGEGKPFSLIQDEISSEAMANEDATPHNIEQPTPSKQTTENSSNESASEEKPKIENGHSAENQSQTVSEDHKPAYPTNEEIDPEKSITVSQANVEIDPEQSIPIFEENGTMDSEPVLEIETSDLVEQHGETASKTVGENETTIQTALPVPNPQPESQPLGAEDIVKPPQTDRVVSDENQAIPQKNQSNTDTVENIPTTNNPSESVKTPDNIPVSKPTETSEFSTQTHFDNTEKTFTDPQTDNSHTVVTKQNKPIISDSTISVPNSEQTVSNSDQAVSNTKELFVNGMTNDNSQVTTESANTTITATTTTNNPEPVQTESPQISSAPLKTDTNKPESTNESISEIQVPNDKESTSTGDSPPNTSDSKSLNVSEVQISANHPETHKHSTENRSFQEHIEQIHIQNDNPVPPTQQPLTSVDNPKATEAAIQPSPNDTPTDVGKQILESIQNSYTQPDGDQQITVRLNPPELGKVFIKFQEQNSELTGVLEVNKAETRVEIEQALPQIARDLANAGIQIKRIDVMLSGENRLGYEAYEDQSPQHSGLYEQDSAGSQTWDNNAYTNGMNDWSMKNANYQPLSEFEETQVGESSINVLM